MKRKLLFSVVAAMMVAANVMAQSDITPPRYDFANQSVGEYTINGFNNGWGPSNAKNAALEGYVNLCGGQGWANGDGSPTDRSKNFQTGVRIYDFGGKIGKALVYKGKDCTNPLVADVPAAAGGIDVQWPQLSFYADSTKVTTGGEEGDAPPFIRISVLFKAISNEAYDAETGCISALEVKGANNNVLNTLAGAFSNMDMMISPEDDDYALEQGWIKVEYDIQVGTPAGNPFAFTLKLANNASEGGETWLEHGAVLVKEIKFISGTDGTYAKGEPASVTKQIDLSKYSGINSVAKENEFHCVALGNVLYVSDVKAGDKVEIYNMVGTKIASDMAIDDNVVLPLNGKGFYIVSINGKRNVKVLNN